MKCCSRPTPSADEADEEEEEKRPVSEAAAVIHKPTPNLPPVLNLHGPPVVGNDAGPSPKRKKRKRKKKKRRVGEETGAAPQTSTG